MSQYDYEGYVIRYETRMSDGKTIRKGAFKINDGDKVPIVYDFYRDGGTHIRDTSIENVLGVAYLENREDGVYARCVFAETPFGLKLKDFGLKNCVKELTIFATHCVIHKKVVTHGNIAAVKIVENI